MGKHNQNNKKHANTKSRIPRQTFGRVTVPHLMVTLPYAENGIITEAAAGLGNYNTWVINSAFDPNFTGGGLQPLGFDQYAQFYGRYRVLSVKFEVDWGGRTAGEPTIVGVYASPQSTLPASSIAWTVQPTPTNRTNLIAGSTGGPTVVKQSQKVKIQNVMGVTSSEFKDDQDFSAILTASPARPCYMHTWIKSLTGTVGSVHYLVRIWMDIEFSQPVALSMS